MMRWKMILTLARAEARLTRRLARYWVFCAASLLIGLVVYIYYSVLHYYFSSYSATAALINPHFLIGASGTYYMLIFLVGAVFLAFDVRAREQRERVAEVVDARPVSNVELLAGKLLGILVPLWLPVIVLLVGIAITGWITGNWPELYSGAAFLLLMEPPAFAFGIALVFLASLLLRNRWLGALVGLVVVVGHAFALYWAPIWFVPALDITGSYAFGFPSDLYQAFILGESLVQRAGVLVVAVGLIFLAAAAHPRRDGSSRRSRALAGVLVTLVGAACMAGVAWSRHTEISNFHAWKQAHEARSEEPKPDVRSIRGRVVVDPGKKLDMDLAVRFRAPEGEALQTALFTLNPGLEVQSASGPDGPLSFTHRDGLLDITLPDKIEGEAQYDLSLKITGEPDVRFAYLDDRKPLLEYKLREAQVILLGILPAVFDHDFVVLMPGIFWLPTSGPGVGLGDPRVHPPDFYDLDLTVEVPKGWLAAGPGRRQEAEGANPGDVAFRFAPPVPVPKAALVAGPLVSRATDVEGVHAEVLMHRSHVRALESLEDAGGEIRKWVGERLRETAEDGFPYPLDAITVVDVPSMLRGYGAEWRKDTVLPEPGMMLLRETGFPTARFDVPFRHPERFQDREGGVPRAKFERLETFFQNDFSGGNVYTGVSRSFFGQTAGRGRDGIPLDFVLEDLTARTVTGRSGYFSAGLFSPDMNRTISETMAETFRPGGGAAKISDTLVRLVTSRPQVWDKATTVALSDLDPWKDPQQTLDVLTLKGGAFSRSLLDTLGKADTARFLGTLRANRMGETFTRDDVVEAAREVGHDVGDVLHVWLDETALPGFVASGATAERVRDGEDGSPRYQVLVTIRNDEPVPGLVRVICRMAGSGPRAATKGGPGGERRRGGETVKKAPVRVPAHGAVEVGLVTSKPPRGVTVDPYLSLNRQSFSVPLPAVDRKKASDREPFDGVRKVKWSPPKDEAVVVDDLDPGFRVEQPASRGWFRLGGRGKKEEATDQGLPVFRLGTRPTRWARRIAATAYGKYRHTTAIVRAGKGRKAIFEAELPEAGRWELQIHLPERRRRGGPRAGLRLGEWNLAVKQGDRRQETVFRADDAESSWNSVEVYDLDAGPVRAELSGGEEARLLLADAVRFVPVGGTAGEDNKKETP